MAIKYIWRFAIAKTPYRLSIFKSSLFLVLCLCSRTATSDDLQTHILLLLQQLKAADYQPIRRSFAIWLNRLLRVKFKAESIPEYHELTEVNAM